MTTIWETVPASEIREGDVLQWDHLAERVRVDWIYESERAWDDDGNPAIGIHVAGPTGQFERGSGYASGKLYGRDWPVVRMLPERAARVSDTNYRTLVR